MPGLVKVKILSARNLPVMDRSTDLTDAFVELRLGPTTYKTEVVKQSLNPVWNTNWFCFEVSLFLTFICIKLSDEALQEESLQIRVFDHDTYSPHDPIGRVYFDLNPLLIKGHPKQLNGWFPIYDTMHGIRGEISLSIRADIFIDSSKHQHSSFEVRYFYSSCLPDGYQLCSLLGFVHELVVEDDPEHLWIEKIRTPRASNEARQRLFTKLSGEIQRKIGRRVLNMGGNVVLGYQLHFDLEGESGVVARGIGTAAFLTECKHSLNTCDKKSPPLHSSKQNHSTLDLSKCDFPFITLSQPPAHLIGNFAGLVSSKSVKIIEKNENTCNQQIRDSWWLELRTEISSHMRSLDCDCVLGYRELCAVYEDVCVLSAWGTAVRLMPTLSVQSEERLPVPRTRIPTSHSQEVSELASSLPSAKFVVPLPGSLLRLNSDTLLEGMSAHSSQSVFPHTSLHSPSVSMAFCRLCHIAKANRNPRKSKIAVCGLCDTALVPEIMLASCEMPPQMEVKGLPSIIQSRVVRSKKENRGDAAAKDISELLPFMEYELHDRLIQKLFLRGMNAIFSLKFRTSIAEDFIATIATGTAVYLKCLPKPKLPKLLVPKGVGYLVTPSLFLMQNAFANKDKTMRKKILLKMKEYRLKSELVHGLRTGSPVLLSNPDFSLETTLDSTLDSSSSDSDDIESRNPLVEITRNQQDDTVHPCLQPVELRHLEPEEICLFLKEPLCPLCE
ncbi:hypothetical protein Ciccas_007070 [Cichlidogyrus casuarinus]|uniref:C2 domain-containing protein n=1 Tax=Cichlidogyrus casuarinus TaxID=1844966 RepID=A0ABD2Q3X0_9PLAT